MSDATEVWSTVRIRMAKVGTDSEAIAAATDRLEGLAALLADEDGVGGVEIRDPTLIAEGPDFVAVERPELIAYTTPPDRGRVEQRARELGSMLALELMVDGEDHEGEAWRDAWKRYYRSLYFRPTRDPGRPALMVRPSWIPRRADDPELELVLDPGRAFGTGLHESTSLCLQALVDTERQFRTVLDLGCGSGILGLAAARLWPELEVLNFADHDPEAVDTARENAELNGLAAGASVTPGYHVIDLGPEGALELDAELVFANIRPKVLIPAAHLIASAVQPGGVAILSGILAEEAAEVVAAYRGLLEFGFEYRLAGWTAVVMTKAAAR